MIYFVGAGPGAEDLITVRGQKLLAGADIVIYAGSLVNPGLLNRCSISCKRYDSAYMTLPEVLAVMEEAAGAGQDLVRLHTGDPSLYGALREQTDALREKNIPFEICPGVSSFCGAAAALEMEYTLPGVSQSVILTRAEGKTGVPERERLMLMAAHQATMVLFLSMGEAGAVSRELIEGGYAPKTPAAIVYKATWPEELVLRTTLQELGETAEKSGIKKTALLIVGDVLEKSYEKSRLYAPEAATAFRKKTAQRGVFYAVGVGRGDPEDLTCKAVRILKSVQVIGRQQNQAAYETAAQACPEIRVKEELELPLPETGDEAFLMQEYQKTAAQIAEKLREGKDAALPVYGNPADHASVGLISSFLEQQGYRTQMIGGLAGPGWTREPERERI